eukprot:gb/GEZN01010550.1/.p1 GENE.gb/GEZN01010550.1/~~gb/GEZN01010550.1/.p1  ORF type:complete len:199 (+),score=15.57 gb/GEZN01010550.1/:46-642(+)
MESVRASPILGPKLREAKLKDLQTRLKLLSGEKTFSDRTNIHDIKETPRYADYLINTPAEDILNSVCLGVTIDGVPIGSKAGRGRMYSFWIISAEILDLEMSDRVADVNRITLGIIPGPNEPKNLKPWLQPLLDELRDLKVSLGYFCADAPAMMKAMEAQSFHGKQGCPYCWELSERYKSLGRATWPHTPGKRARKTV